MLYLIRTFGRRGRSMLKVGYTSDLQKRMENYYHSNPLYERISARQGDLKEEKRLQLYLQLLGLKCNILDEWYIDSPEVLKHFHDTQERIGRILWRHRDLVWKKEDLKKGADKRLREIYEDLRKLYLPKGEYKTSGQIEREYTMIVAQETLKKMRSDEYLMDFW